MAGVIVDCPDRMEIEVGATYECPARVRGQRSTTLLLTVTDEDGAYTWAEA